jgi:formylglycine-generating enzyme required for sulfatase activity
MKLPENQEPVTAFIPGELPPPLVPASRGHFWAGISLLLLAGLGLLAAGAAWGWRWHQDQQWLAAEKAKYEAALSQVASGLLEQYGDRSWAREILREAAGKDAATRACAYSKACYLLPCTVREATDAKREADRRTATRVVLQDAEAAKARGDWQTVRTEALLARKWAVGNVPARRLLAESANALGGPPPGRVPGGCSPIPMSGTVASGWASEIVHEATGIELVYIAPGAFVMGSPVSEAGREDDEVQHQVTISNGFYLGRCEVTQEQWVRIMGANPSEFKGVGDDAPVEQVRWVECQAFCQKAGNGMRLPTEAEWEYACRAGTTGAYAGTGELDTMGWARDKRTTHSVGQKEPNAWGLYDMHGNVWEWCADLYGPYPAGAVTDPEGAAASIYRVYRGGRHFGCDQMCRSARRNQRGPDSLNWRVGLRVVVPAGQP